MIDSPLPPLFFQTFFVSRETSNSPLINDIIHTAKTLHQNHLLSEGKGSISVTNGNRILITGEDVSLMYLSSEDIVEIADYNPIKNMVLAAGKIVPGKETPLHWMIQKARQDVHAVVFVPIKDVSESLQKKLPITEHSAPIGTIDSIKDVLRTLRRGKTIIIKNNGILFSSLTLREIEETAAPIGKEMHQ